MVPDDNRGIGSHCIHRLVTEKSPVAVTRHRGFPRKGLERREVEKRIYGVGKEAAHGFRNLSVIKILFGFEHRIKET